MDEWVETFFAETRESFLFLEHQYSYKRLEGHIDHPDDERDALALSEYVGSQVGVRISWGFANVSMDVAFIQLFQSEIFPEESSFFPLTRPNVSNAISLYSLAERLGTSHDPDFVLKDIDKPRQRYKRAQLIRSNMHEIVAGLARATQTYATPILKGDTSIFPEVMDYYLAKQKRLYPNLFIPGLKQPDHNLDPLS